MDIISKELITALFGYNPTDFSYYTLANKTQSFPKYNLIKESDNDLVIEFALAGYKKSELDITVDNNFLTVKTIKQDEEIDEKCYLSRGVAHRAFSVSSKLPEYFEVKSANMEDGMLIIKLHREIPEQLRPKTIEIK